MSVKKYTKKPIEVEAVQFKKGNYCEVIEFLGVKEKGDFDKCGHGIDTNDGVFKISSLDGIMYPKENDFIIKGVKGEFYPCDQDIFNMTYEIVPEKSSSVEKFLDFLDKNGAKAQYFENLGIDGKSITWLGRESLDRRDYLICAFTWTHSKQGSDFWSILDNRWRNECKKEDQ